MPVLVNIENVFQSAAAPIQSAQNQQLNGQQHPHLIVEHQNGWNHAPVPSGNHNAAVPTENAQNQQLNEQQHLLAVSEQHIGWNQNHNGVLAIQVAIPVQLLSDEPEQEMVSIDVLENEAQGTWNNSAAVPIGSGHIQQLNGQHVAVEQHDWDHAPYPSDNHNGVPAIQMVVPVHVLDDDPEQENVIPDVLGSGVQGAWNLPPLSHQGHLSPFSLDLPLSPRGVQPVGSSEPDDTVYIVVVGDSLCGKTRLIESFFRVLHMPRSEPVWDTCYREHRSRVSARTGEDVEVVIREVPGYVSALDRRLSGYPDIIDVLVMCFDLADPDALGRVASSWHPTFCGEVFIATEYILVGLKADKIVGQSATGGDCGKTLGDLSTEDRLRYFDFVDCSSVTGEGVSAVMESILEAVLEEED